MTILFFDTRCVWAFFFLWLFCPQVMVNVLDVNDVTPTFPRAYEGPFEVTEGQPGPRVWTLRASDEDSGLNGKVEYSITGGDHQSQYPVVLLITLLHILNPHDVSLTFSVHPSDRWVHGFASGRWAESEEGRRTGQRNDGLLQHHHHSSRPRHAIAQQFGEAFAHKRTSKHACRPRLWPCDLKRGGSSKFHFCFPQCKLFK